MLKAVNDTVASGSASVVTGKVLEGSTWGASARVAIT